MGSLSGEATLPFSILSPFSLLVNSDRKEFAPQGANSEFAPLGANSLLFMSRPYFGRVSLSKEGNWKFAKQKGSISVHLSFMGDIIENTLFTNMVKGSKFFPIKLPPPPFASYYLPLPIVNQES